MKGRIRGGWLFAYIMFCGMLLLAAGLYLASGATAGSASPAGPAATSPVVPDETGLVPGGTVRTADGKLLHTREEIEARGRLELALSAIGADHFRPRDAQFARAASSRPPHPPCVLRLIAAPSATHVLLLQADRGAQQRLKVVTRGQALSLDEVAVYPLDLDKDGEEDEAQVVHFAAPTALEGQVEEGVSFSLLSGTSRTDLGELDPKDYHLGPVEDPLIDRSDSLAKAELCASLSTLARILESNPEHGDHSAIASSILQDALRMHPGLAGDCDAVRELRQRLAETPWGVGLSSDARE